MRIKGLNKVNQGELETGFTEDNIEEIYISTKAGTFWITECNTRRTSK